MIVNMKWNCKVLWGLVGGVEKCYIQYRSFTILPFIYITTTCTFAMLYSYTPLCWIPICYIYFRDIVHAQPLLRMQYFHIDIGRPLLHAKKQKCLHVKMTENSRKLYIISLRGKWAISLLQWAGAAAPNGLCSNHHISFFCLCNLRAKKVESRVL